MYYYCIMTDEDKYESIINLPHHVSATRPRMTMRDRAAQFAPFAPLSGHGDAIREKEEEVAEYMENESRCDLSDLEGC